jgi:hypothetical protein
MFAVDAYIEITSVVARVIPRVRVSVSKAAIVVSYARYCEFAILAPACLIAILKVPEDPARFAIVIVDTTVEVDDGTVYKVVRVVALGLL